MNTRLCSAALFVVLAAALVPAQQFIANPVLPEGASSVVAAVSADFNGDGNTDLAFVGGSSNGSQVVIQLGSSDGSFTIAQTIHNDLFGGSVVTGDWNADGIPDLAVTAAVTLTYFVDVYLGVGDGTFSQENEYPLHSLEAESLTAGDLNGDGIADLVIADAPGGISVLLGQGGGNFAAPVNYSLPDLGYLIGITTVDLNRDGKLDVAATGTNDWTHASDIIIYLGRGDGTFQNPVELPTTFPSRIISVDLNKDGMPDLVTGSVNVFLGNGDGTFQAERYYNSLVAGDTVSGTPLAAADVDADGNLDLLAAGGELGPSAVSVLRGNGKGSFQRPVLLGTTTSNPIELLIADFNKDGHLDAILPDAFAPCFNLMLGDSNGKFVARRDFSIQHSTHNQPQVASLTVADVNSDGNPDVVMLDDGEDDTPRIIIMNGQKNGTFVGPKDVPLGSNAGRPVSIDAADFDGDGAPDAVVANGNQISVLLGDGHNNFGSPVNYAGSGGPYQVIAADVNGDATPDIVGTNRGSNTISVFLNDGAGHFDTRVDSAVGYEPYTIALGDFNRDGKLDVVAAIDGKHNPTAVALLGNGDGTFKQAGQLASGGGGSAVAVGDFNNDGNPDVVVQSGQLLFYPGNGDGTFGAFKITPGCGVGAVGDFNRDGKLDMVPICGASYKLAEFLMGQGDGTFKVEQSTVVDGDYAEGIGDFNHDGALDVASAGENLFKFTLSILLNTGTK
ncbi:MAG: VCBS repeat-containing protein [Acidobacteriales bacterium]|nr:VCBS repeat-containing protein [Terriglobales bacterium]